MIRWIQLGATLVPAALLLIVYWGDAFRKPLITTPLYFGLLTGLVWLTTRPRLGPPSVPTATGHLLLRAEPTDAKWIRLTALVAGALGVLLLSSARYQGMVIYPIHNVGLYLAAVLAAMLLTWLIAYPPSMRVALMAIAISGLAIRACGVWQWEIDPARRDMLALIVSALDTFLSGENPYRFHQMQIGSEVPLTYPPGLWLSHLPAYLLGLDIRWTAWLADGIVVIGLGTCALRIGSTARGAVLLALAIYLFLPDIHWNAIYAEPQIDWAVLALMTAAALTRRPFALAALYGLAMTMRPLNLVLFPFLLIWWLRDSGPTVARRAVLICGVIAAAMYGPFIFTAPDDFYLGTVRWLLEYGEAHSRWFHNMLGVSGQYYRLDLSHYLFASQLIASALVVGLAVWKQRATRSLLAFSALGYAVFVAFNSIIWMSFWIGVSILAIGAIADPGRTESGKTAPRPPKNPRRWLLVELSALAVIIAALIGILTTLFSHFSRVPTEPLKQIESKFQAGDVVVDLSGYRTAFLNAPLVLAPQSLPVGVQLAHNPFQVIGPATQPLEPVLPSRVWIIERFGLAARHDNFYSSDVDGLYTVTHHVPIGPLQIRELNRNTEAVDPPLSKSIGQLSVAAIKNTDGSALWARWINRAWQLPNAPRWQTVRRQRCRFGRMAHPMIWAHPWPDAVLRIETPLEKSSRFITLYGGLVDRAPQWKRAPIHVSVYTDKGHLATRRFPNEPGLSGATWPLPEHAKKLIFEISAKDVSKRHFCFDAVLSR